MLFLGVDAGGTKTIFATCDQQGRVLARLRTGPMTAEEPQQIEGLLAHGIEALFKKMEMPARPFSGACLGLPCLGEDASRDKEAQQAVQRMRWPAFRLCNDCELGWAGSLGMEPGINVVAGTGMIAYGRDGRGGSARSGGWSELFSDEGSGYWLGRKLLELFSKQSDGRLPRGPLYSLVREALSLDEDFAIIPLAHRDYLPYRDKTASLQRLLLQAAQAGDTAAVACYAQAAGEIAQAVLAIRDALDFSGTAPVSYSGGVFRTGEWIMEPFTRALQGQKIALRAPLAPPWAGALMLAAGEVGLDSNAFRQNLTAQAALPAFAD